MNLQDFYQFLFEAKAPEITDEMNANAKAFLDSFDKIYVVSMPGRDEKWNRVKKWMRRIGVSGYEKAQGYHGKDNFAKDKENMKSVFGRYKDIIEFEDIKEKDLNAKNASMYGVGEAHRRIILKAMKAGAKRPLILEDDAIPAIGLFEDGKKVADLIKNRNYDLINFGIKDSKIDSHFKGNGLLRTLKEGKTITQLHAYTIHPDYYEGFIKDSLGSYTQHMDITLSSKLQDKGSYLASSPRLFLQASDYSDNQGKVVNKGGSDEIAFDDLDQK